MIVLGNLDDAGLAVDAMSKDIADFYLPGTALRGLRVVADPDAGETATIRRVLAEVAAGRDTTGAVAGLGTRLPGAVRERLTSALAVPIERFASLGQERLTPFHFNLDPVVVRLRRYRAITAAGTRYLTVRLAEDGTVHGVLIEDGGVA